MKNSFFTIILFLLLSLATGVFSQGVAISADPNTTPDPSAALDITSNDKGILIPRLTESQRTMIASPATGLLVYQTDGIDGFYFYNGNVWQHLSSDTPSELEKVSEGGKTGWRLLGSNPVNHGNIGERSVDLVHATQAFGGAGATGNHSFAVGRNSGAAGAASIAMGESAFATGKGSVAISEGEAQGSYSFALGPTAYSYGNYSFTQGYEVSAAYGSQAFGTENRADGHHSTAFGLGNESRGYGNMTIGVYSDPILAENELQTAPTSTTPLFIIGNGEYDNRSNAMVVRKDGKVGIGTNLPAALLHTDGIENGGGNIVFAGQYKISPGSAAVEGAGTRMMWYPDKAAFRVGNVSGLNWNTDSIGAFSTAWGADSKARGSISTAWGLNTTAPSYLETALGRYNTNYLPNNSNGWNPNDRLFVIGNGLSNNNRRDALVLMKNGSMGIGTSVPDPSAIVDIQSTSAGFLPPRMTNSQRNAINSPAIGLTIFNTNRNCLQFWNGQGWFDVCEGLTHQIAAYPSGTVHCNPDNPTPVVEVLNPISGKIWMDRNLGATSVASNSSDQNAFGDLYQWGRRADGHQCRNSNTTTVLSNSDTPSHGNFILVTSSPFNWRSPQNVNLWQGVSGINNPCPSGFRLPTNAEWNAERNSWVSQNSVGAINSPLKLPLSGLRDGSNGSVSSMGFFGFYWSSTVNTSYLGSLTLAFGAVDAGEGASFRATGNSVRCIKD